MSIGLGTDPVGGELWKTRLGALLPWLIVWYDATMSKVTKKVVVTLFIFFLFLAVIFSIRSKYKVSQVETSSHNLQGAEQAVLPPAFLAAESSSEALYDDILAKDWEEAGQEGQTLKGNFVDLRNATLVSGDETALVDELLGYVERQDRLTALQKANTVFLFLITQLGNYRSSFPHEIMFLDYLGRELQIGALNRDNALFHTTQLRTKTTWEKLKPMISGLNAAGPVEKFEVLMAQLERMTDVRQLATLPEEILEGVDALEQVYQSGEPDTQGEVEPARVESIPGTDTSRIILTAKAAERLDIQTVPVRGGVIPYAAVLYDAHGATWVYTNPEPLVFNREPIMVDYVADDQAVLLGGLPPNSTVVTVGAAELYGSETEFEEE